MKLPELKFNPSNGVNGQGKWLTSNVVNQKGPEGLGGYLYTGFRYYKGKEGTNRETM
jgi:hypothetical protein